MKKISKILLAILAVVCCTVLFACNIQTEDIKKRYTVSVIDGEGGGVFEEGTKVSVVANEKGEFYDFTGWYEGEVKLADSKTYEFEVSKDITLKATYSYDPYKNLSADEANDLINDINRAIFTTANPWDSWTTTVELETEEISPLTSEQSIKVTIAPGKDADGEYISPENFVYDAVWSQVKFGFMKEEVLDLTEYTYVEFDFKQVNAQDWLAVNLWDAEGNMIEIGGDLPKFADAEAKRISTDGWYHIVLNIASRFNYEYLLNDENPLDADQQKTLNILKNCVEMHLTFSDSKSDLKQPSIIYVDNLHVTNDPFDASELEKEVNKELEVELKEEADLTNKMTIAWQNNEFEYTWTKGEEYSAGGDSKYGYKLYYPARTGDDKWPSVQFHLNTLVDFTKNDVSIDIKPISNHPWIEIHYYDKDWQEILVDEKRYSTSSDLTAGQWNTLTLTVPSEEVQLITIYLTSKGTNVANELWFDNFTVTPKSSTHPNKILFNGDSVSLGKKVAKADFLGAGKALSFEFTMSEGVAYITFMDGEHSWANYTGHIKLERVGDVVTCDKGDVTAIENGWYKAVIASSSFAGDAETQVPNNDAITMIYSGKKDNFTVTEFYIDPDTVQGCVANAREGKAKYEGDPRIYFPEVTAANFTKLAKALFAAANKGVYFEFTMTEGQFVVALLDGDHGWANYSGNITFTKTGDTVTCDKGEVVEVGDGWYGVTIPYSAFTGDADTAVPANDGISMLYGSKASCTAEVYIDIASFAAVTLSTIDRSGAVNVGAGSTISLPGNAKYDADDIDTIEFDILNNDEENTKFSLMVGNWTTYMGYFDCAAGIDSTGVTSSEMEDGYYHIVIKVAEVTRQTGAWVDPGFHDNVEFIYFHGSWTTATGKLDNIVVTTK